MPLSPSYRGFVYLIGNRKFGWYKIGKAKTPDIRIQHVGILLPFSIELIALWKVENPLGCERIMHSLYASYRINGEWFGFFPETLQNLIDNSPPFTHERVIVCPKIKNSSKSDSLRSPVQSDWKSIRKVLAKEVKSHMQECGMEDTRENRIKTSKLIRKKLKIERDTMFSKITGRSTSELYARNANLGKTIG
jgi:hypothetical protein